MKSPPKRISRAFTLIEMLVVIAIIVGVLAMTVPLVGVLNGNRSVEAGFNLVAASLEHARELAVYDQTTTGAFFSIDPATGRTAIQYVQVPTSSALPNLDFAPCGLSSATLPPFASEDTVLLPPGVGVRVLNDNTRGGVTANLDRYLATGAIFFDPNGQVVYLNYQVPTTYVDA